MLQLLSEDFPELVFPSETDLFQLLWCPMYHEDQGYGPRVETFWRRRETITPLGTTPVPERRLPGFVPANCRILADRVEEIPGLRDLGDEKASEVDAWLEEHWDRFWPSGETQEPSGIWDQDWPYLVEISASPVSKVGGHPDWIQDGVVATCGCGRQLEHLLTVASNESDPSAWRSVSADDPGPQNRDAANSGLVASALDDNDNPWPLHNLASPTGLMLGDLGSVYVLMCRFCEGNSIQTSFQST